VISISGELAPRVTGFEITLKMRTGGKTRTRSFECKGLSEFIDPRMGEILAFLSGNSDGLITGIEGDRNFAGIATGNMDALSSFLEGEEAWNKLDSDAAYFEYRTATENDPDFSLAFLRLADVQVFRGNWEDARIKMEIAFKKKDRLIAYDLLRLKALLARIDSKPAEEREYLRQLTEAFPFKKEYLYEFAESYFHVGDAEEAIKYYSRALTLDPEYSLAHNHIAYSYAWMGDHQLAEEHFKKYISLDNTANSYDSLASGYMFAGRYDKAIETLEKGIALDPDLDYLYRNMAGNYLLQGALSLAAENMNRQINVTQLETTKVSARVYLAFIELSRGAADRAAKELTPARQFYSKEPFAGRLDESPVSPFWLTGVLAARKNDLPQLREMIKILEKKISGNNVTATNYFPVYKFYLHLKVLEAYLTRNEEQALASIDEARRISSKMGYWDSIFNLPYFFNEFAAVLIDLGNTDEALDLLEDAARYNPNYAETHVNLARIHILKKKKGEAADDIARAREALSKADRSYILVGELESLAKAIK
jgi:tetratricopeptide (TPR) repeat protein